MNDIKNEIFFLLKIKKIMLNIANVLTSFSNTPAEWNILTRYLRADDKIIESWSIGNSAPGLTYEIGHQIRKDNQYYYWLGLTKLDNQLILNHRILFDIKTGNFIEVNVNCFSLGWFRETTEGYCQEMVKELRENKKTWDEIE